MKIKRILFIISSNIGVLLLLGVGLWYMSSPRYVIIEDKRALSINRSGDDFVIMPAKIKVTNIWGKRPLELQFNVYNGEGHTDYDVSVASSQYFDDGYEIVRDYDIVWMPEKMRLGSNSKGTITVNIAKVSNKYKSIKQEFAICVTQQANEQDGINIVRNYVVEILLN